MKDYRNLLKAINKAEGWEIRFGKGGHRKVYAGGKFTGVSIPASGSDVRGVKNDTAALRRAGLNV
jgi:hypothetical protein